MNNIFVNYFFGSKYKNQKLDGSKWLFQVPLTVTDNPVAEKGIFQAIEATTLSAAFPMGQINVPRGEEDGFNSTNEAMDLWKATLNYENQPVELYKTPVSVTFDAKSGKFADGDLTKYFEGDAGDEFAIEEPSRTAPTEEMCTKGGATTNLTSAGTSDTFANTSFANCTPSATVVFIFQFPATIFFLIISLFLVICQFFKQGAKIIKVSR